MGLPGLERILTISSAVWIQMHQRDGQTDTRRQQWPRLRISSRGKNFSRLYSLLCTPYRHYCCDATKCKAVVAIPPKFSCYWQHSQRIPGSPSRKGIWFVL